MPITDDVITATSQLTVIGGAGGPVFSDFVPLAGKAYVIGRLGLGTINPQNTLDVEGAVAVGAGYSGSIAAPLNGLAVEGSVGIGTNSPAAKLDVAGTLRVSQDAQLLGNVGIGTTAPAAKLQVAGGALMPSAGNTASSGILFPQNPGGGAGDAAWIRYYARAGESTTLEIGVANDADDHISLMASGNVGIGTTAPVAKLDVAGTMRVNGSLTVTGSIAATGSISATGGISATGSITAGRSDIYFTSAGHNHTGIGNAAGNAAIENAADYAALMILGRAGTPKGRAVRLWDYLSVEGDMALLSKHAFRGSDSWLRLNQDGAFSSGVHTPGVFAPGSLNVGGVNGWGNPGGGNVWIAGNVSYGGQLDRLEVADNFTATVRAADFCLGFSGRRGSPGRALVDYVESNGAKTLRINYGGDWSGGCRYNVSMLLVSSRKIKDNVEDLSSESAQDIIDRLHPVTFNLKSDKQKEKALYLGFIAEDVPAQVGSPDQEAVNNDHIVAVLTRVLKDQQQTIAELRGRIERVESSGAAHA